MHNKRHAILEFVELCASFWQTDALSMPEKNMYYNLIDLHKKILKVKNKKQELIKMIKYVNSQECENEIKNNEIVIVDFFATWCGPCQIIAKELEKIENEYNILKINIDENRDFAIDKGIEVVPTIFIYRNGKKAKELEGYKTAEELKQEIQNI